MFDEKTNEINGCINIHKKVIQLNDNLYIAGFGGSIPGYINNKEIWEGYPYKNENEFKKEFNILTNKMLNKKKEINNIQYILFTHCGPQYSSTTIDWRNNDLNKSIQSGSKTLSNIFFDNNLVKNIICVIY